MNVSGVVHEGFLHKRGRVRREIVRRWYSLYEDGELCWAKSKFDLEVKGRVVLSGCTRLGPGRDHPQDELYGFEFDDSDGRSRELLAGSSQEREVWVHSLCSVIASLNDDKEGVEAVRRRAVAYAQAAASAGPDCLRQILSSPLPGEQADVDLEKLNDRGLVVAGDLYARKGPWTSFKKRSFELTTEGTLRFFDDEHRRKKKKFGFGARQSTDEPCAQNERQAACCFSLNVSQAEVKMDRRDSQSILFRSSSSSIIELRCTSQAQRHDVVFGACFVAEVLRLLDRSTEVVAARRRSHVIDAGKRRLFVSCVTWNANEKDVDEADVREVAEKVGQVDVLAVGVQEVAPRLMALASPQASAAKWDEVWQKVLAAKDLELVEACSVGPTRLSLFVKRDCLWQISRVSSDSVPCGNAGAANKGAAAVKLFARHTSLLFVGAHLAAHEAHHLRRDADAKRIDERLFSEKHKNSKTTASSSQRIDERIEGDVPRRDPYSPVCCSPMDTDDDDDYDDDDEEDDGLGNTPFYYATHQRQELNGERAKERHQEHCDDKKTVQWQDMVIGDESATPPPPPRLGQPEEVADGNEENLQFLRQNEERYRWRQEEEDANEKPRRQRPASRLVASHSAVFVFGDLNYRIDLKREEVEHLVRDAFYGDDESRLLPADTALQVLLDRDQLLHRLKAGARQYFDFPTGLAEQPISFPPTFKYDPGTDRFETSKFRVPSWCDRVLYSPKDIVRPLFYDSVPAATSSDHRPVVAKFAVSVDGENIFLSDE